MIRNLIIIIIVSTIKMLGQISTSPELISFPQITTDTADSISFYVVNNNTKNIELKINNLKTVYSLSDSLLLIPSNDSGLVWIKYNPDNNVIDKDLIFITSDDSAIGGVINLTGSGKFGDAYDLATFNLYDLQLKTALTQSVSGHTSLGYNLARDKMYMVIDNQKANGQNAAQNTLECVYTGRLAVGYNDRTDAQNNYNFNTEHTWPQSNFSEAEPMKSDLYHLFPTDVTSNSMRANYPFGKAVSNVTWQVGGSKLGSNTLGQIIFEPRDVHKGDVSRSMFYFITRYPVNYGGFFSQAQENVFREWNKLDSVSAVENARNNAVASFQLKRNPFIDHPEFIERIYSFATSNVRPNIASLNVLPLIVNFDSTFVDSSNSKQFYIANSGSGQLVVDSITISDPRFNVIIKNASIDPYSSVKVILQFNPDSLTSYNAVLTVYSKVGHREINITGFGKDDPVEVKAESVDKITFLLAQNYPNPFNPSTVISYQLPVSGKVILKVYDVLGNTIATLVNEEQAAGSYNVTLNMDNKSDLGVASGIYFYHLQAGSFNDVKKMILIK